ncbi:hypothetical protein IF1G_02004 [Cordyceps javanica]|uniref:Uncharacterized protein n=1 Tax=Cordyceps javanica TaxID=43265 RepID=A0A545VDS6_9HYPO|nr:hypothetical protein IF1G_02004 [Cordyceps javanica]
MGVAKWWWQAGFLSRCNEIPWGGFWMSLYSAYPLPIIASSVIITAPVSSGPVLRAHHPAPPRAFHPPLYPARSIPKEGCRGLASTKFVPSGWENMSQCSCLSFVPRARLRCVGLTS